MSENEIRLECLKLAQAAEGSALSSAGVHPAHSEQVLARAEAYAAFCLANG